MNQMQEQLTQLFPKLPRTPDVDTVTVDLQQGVAEVKTPAGKTQIVLTETQQQAFVNNALSLQNAAIREKNIAMWANIGMASLTILTAAGAAYALYRGASGADGKASSVL